MFPIKFTLRLNKTNNDSTFNNPSYLKIFCIRQKSKLKIIEEGVETLKIVYEYMAHYREGDKQKIVVIPESEILDKLNDATYYIDGSI